jgi:hypothetical protein
MNDVIVRCAADPDLELALRRVAGLLMDFAIMRRMGSVTVHCHEGRPTKLDVRLVERVSEREVRP